MEKKRSRLKKRARQLTDYDLVEVLAMRKASKEDAGAADSGPSPETPAAQSSAAESSSSAGQGVSA